MNAAPETIERLRLRVDSSRALGLASMPVLCVDADAILTDYKRLQASNAALREALQKCSAILAGFDMSKQALIDALEQSRAALNDTKGE